MKESETESVDLEAEKQIMLEEGIDQQTSIIERRAPLSKSNLQILLSQNDILPFLKWLKHQKSGLCFEEYIQKNQKVLIIHLS